MQSAETTDRLIPSRKILLISIVAFLTSLAIRLIHYNQSLWCDEMTGLLEYISAPWSKIVAPGPGEYVPNNHVLFMILARLCLKASGTSHSPGITAALIRLPSLIAGSLTPLALAWPMRRRSPVLAILIALFAALNPWLVAFSDEARGYALMILLGIIATNLLLNDHRRWPTGYGVAVAAMLYTVQVAGILVLAHAVVLLIFRRASIGSWIRGMLVAGAISVLLLLPMFRGIGYYYHHPLAISSNWIDFVNQLPRFTIAGEYLPAGIDPLIHTPDFRQGFFYWLVPIAILMIGSVLAGSQAELKPSIWIMATASLLFPILSLFDSEFAQVRFAPWCGIWLILALSSIANWCRLRFGTFAVVGVVACAAAWFAFRDTALLPSQPVREAMLFADARAPANADIVMALLTASESAQIYGKSAIQHHQLSIANDPHAFAQAERTALEKTGQRPWVILSFEYLPHDLKPDFWQYFGEHYQLETRLSGRISPVAIYRPISLNQSTQR